jgi:hypothetical protein
MIDNGGKCWIAEGDAGRSARAKIPATFSSGPLPSRISLLRNWP